MKKVKKLTFTKKNLKRIPESEGVYVFWKKDTPVYIGKANNLRARLRSYFALSLARKTKRMLESATHVSYVRVDSEFNALLMEAELVRTIKPQYNTALRDDKHPLYIVITKDEYPRVFAARKGDLKSLKAALVFGPFPSSKNVKKILRSLRRAFPYAAHTLGKRGCLYSQIGLCSPCPNIIERLEGKEKRALRKKYLENIRYIKNMLTGKHVKIVKELERKMKVFSKESNFEEAKKIRDQIYLIDYITKKRVASSSFIKNPNLLEDIREEEITDLKKLLRPYWQFKSLRRIECFDVSHISGSFTAASMVTFINGEPEKKYYRHFKVRQTKKKSDTGSLAEIAKRRMGNLKKWGRPDLILVDGGKGQVSVMEEVFSPEGIVVVGIAKSNDRLIVKKDGKFSQISTKKRKARNLVQRLRNEAHRFARRYHHKLLSKYLISNK